MDQIYILDRITVRAGELRNYQVRLRERYLPLARERGMTLAGQWITPPIELVDAPNELVLLWSLPGTAEFWAMRSRSGDPELAAWWEESDSLTLERERRFMAPGEIL
ncbi:MAG: hypothetical protein J4G09_00330 [Proteobacteria bacterium]|nr:hypothetical protein [Pseudomonadota bacterium]